MGDQPATTPRPQSDLTSLLVALRAGNQRAADALLPAVYDELRAMAQSLLLAERPNHTLQATALVHEAYLKLAPQSQSNWQDRRHFLAIAAQAMRRVLVDHARGRNRLKRGAGERPLLLSDICAISPQREIDILALDEAMLRLADRDPLDARIVEMRFFSGLEVQEIAEVLGVSTKTVQRHWNFARAWLYRALTGDDSRGSLTELS